MGVVIVTGGTFGLGQSITVDLARRGHRVVAIGLAQAQVSSTAQGFEGLLAELRAEGCEAEVHEADVANADDVQRVVARTVSTHGVIDGLVNNAAVGPLGTVLDTDEATFERIVGVNLKGTYLMSRAALPHMIRAGGGSIVNIGSGAGYGKPNMAIYSASKGAILALSTAMAYDHFHDRVRVNVAIPGGGGIVSGMSVGRMGGDADAFRSKPAPGTAAGRPATGRDLANAVAFLLSEDAAAISGTVLDVGCFAHQGGPIPPAASSPR
ncbi:MULTISPECIES: SDR family oxidoreductase [unclassified Variovorax]|jgi:NAD(P)-dependent dehydrogenase (short-subunit alcohol dehydrogenase family)|uniref:SDR family NAD(P)-dependent oxidoreductase n=1 Tax=unclassified Variovorax TaxID=663243 RepID=UPI00086BCF49|nr:MULTISPECIES: SDR family oxidoreductase [unclassified Variovorax]MBN8756580.1 SDR family oxidoreductase [Variovorax sp.]ODU18973.1 MAG: short-chain dehydrogenase [Variovorax sp. SCN 67-85]ODV23614.1 MAG: short-chain dehydrogenase [Variovorax sp. SCN 67-20]OJZ08238.1 MAG: short-chain dehydrogenase [Variovorax sp. 67-131]